MGELIPTLNFAIYILWFIVDAVSRVAHKMVLSSCSLPTQSKYKTHIFCGQFGGLNSVRRLLLSRN